MAFSLDNDFFVGMDRHYTNGLKIGWLSDAQQAADGCALATGLCALPGISGADKKQAWSLSLQQIMVTPENISRSVPDYSDLPYVGFTHVEWGLYSWDDQVLTGYGLRLGVVGEDSGAKQSQIVIHQLIGSDEPKGWDHQLGQDIIGGVYFLQSHHVLHHQTAPAYAWDMHLAYGVDLNNFIASAKAGVFISFGHHHTLRFLPDFTGLSNSAAMVGRVEGKDEDGWSIFAGLFGEYQAYSYVVEEAPSAYYHLQAEPWLGNLMLGFSHRWEKLQLIFTLRGSNSLIKQDKAPLSFGNLTFLWSLP